MLVLLELLHLAGIGCVTHTQYEGISGLEPALAPAEELTTIACKRIDAIRPCVAALQAKAYLLML